MDFVGHPDDESNPTAADALSDDDIGQMSSASAVSFIAEAKAVLSQDPNSEPELCFALGRVALLHGDLETAQEYLMNAANRGSGAACAYLRAPECTHGVFVVGFVGGKSYWLDPVSSAHLSFEEVMLRLEKRATELEIGHRGKAVEAIRVIGIDFRAP